jgi:hypothetical protein
LWIFAPRIASVFFGCAAVEGIDAMTGGRGDTARGRRGDAATSTAPVAVEASAGAAVDPVTADDRAAFPPFALFFDGVACSRAAAVRGARFLGCGVSPSVCLLEVLLMVAEKTALKVRRRGNGIQRISPEEKGSWAK